MTMANRRPADDRTTRWMRWIARGLGSLVAVLWVLIGIAEIAFPHTPPSPEASLQGAILTCLGITTVLGVPCGSGPPSSRISIHGSRSAAASDATHVAGAPLRFALVTYSVPPAASSRARAAG